MEPIHYIVIKQGVAAHKVPDISARATMTSYLTWRDDVVCQVWVSLTCARRIVVANPHMFVRLKDQYDPLVLHDEQDHNEEVALMPKIDQDYPEDFINLPNWYVNA